MSFWCVCVFYCKYFCYQTQKPILRHHVRKRIPLFTWASNNCHTHLDDTRLRRYIIQCLRLGRYKEARMASNVGNINVHCNTKSWWVPSAKSHHGTWLVWHTHIHEPYIDECTTQHTAGWSAIPLHVPLASPKLWLQHHKWPQTETDACW